MPILEMRLEATTRGNVVWPVPAALLPALPETLDCRGLRLERKSEFHLTVLGHDDARRLFAGEAARFARWLEAWRRLDARVEWHDELWLLRLPIGHERIAHSLAVACAAPALAAARHLLSAWTGVDLPAAPAHITLFTAGDPRGIAVADDAALRERRIETGTWRSFGLGAPQRA